MQVKIAFFALFAAALAAPVPNPGNSFARRQLAISRDSDGNVHTLTNGHGIEPTPGVGEIGDAIYEDADGVHTWGNEEYNVYRRQLAITRDSDGNVYTLTNGPGVEPTPDVGEVGDAIYEDADGVHTWDNAYY